MKKKYPVRNPDIVARKEQKEALLFNPSDGHMLCINETGMFVWDLCDGGNAAPGIVEKMTEAYDVTLDKAAGDYSAFIKDMKKTGFIGYKT